MWIYGGSQASLLPGDTVYQIGGPSNGQVLDVFGFDGETMSGLKIGAWVTTVAVAAADCWLIISPNGDQVNCSTTGDITSGAGIVIASAAATVAIEVEFTLTCNSTKTGASRTGTVTAKVSGTTFNMNWTWADSVTPLGWFRLELVQKSDRQVPGVTTFAATNTSVATPCQMWWKALGN